jgi:small-conductance mechanosensitive channel
VQDILDGGLDTMTALLPNLAAASFVVVLFALLGKAAGKAVDRFSDRREEQARRAARVTRRLVAWTLNLVGLVLALQILGLTGLATSLLATGGFAAIVLGFAFREIGENLLAGLMLGLSRSFEVGDLIESSGHTGEVRDIKVRHVHLRTADGRDVFVPSASILQNVLVNYTRDSLRRGEFTVGVDYAEPLDRALRLALEAVRGVDGVLVDPPASARIETFDAQFVVLKVLFWVNTDTGAGLSSTRSRVMGAALTALRGAGITISSDVSNALTVAPLDVRVVDPSTDLH